MQTYPQLGNNADTDSRKTVTLRGALDYIVVL